MMDDLEYRILEYAHRQSVEQEKNRDAVLFAASDIAEALGVGVPDAKLALDSLEGDGLLSIAVSDFDDDENGKCYALSSKGLARFKEEGKHLRRW